MHKAKRANFSIATATQVGGTVLHPGDYQVREINTPSGPALQFARLFRNELASELVQADEEEIVAQVEFTHQALSAPPKHTKLVLASNTTDATGLEIRGSAVAFEFAPAEMTDKAKAMAVCTSAGQPE